MTDLREEHNEDNDDKILDDDVELHHQHKPGSLLQVSNGKPTGSTLTQIPVSAERLGGGFQEHPQQEEPMTRQHRRQARVATNVLETQRDIYNYVKHNV